MNPSIFVTVSTEPDISSAPRENIRYDIFVQKLLKPLPENLNALHIGLGLAGEMCELADTPDEKVDEVEEYGDYEFYLQALLNHYELTINDCGTHYGTVDFNEFVSYTGQLIDCIKREYIYNKPRELERIKQCINKISCYLIDEYTNMDMTPQEVLQANAIKLEKRYAGLYYSDEAAQARADKA